MKVLISLTSYNPKLDLQKVISNYQATYTKYDLEFVLSCNYPLPFEVSNSVIISNVYTSVDHVWNNKQYIRDTLNTWDYVIESDDDILVPISTFENYRAHEGLPIDYIPGVLCCETRLVDGMEEMFILPSLRFMKCYEEQLTMNDIRYYVPTYRHSACFIADKVRYSKALNMGLSLEPCSIKRYHPQEWSRTQIYFLLREVIAVDQIENSLVYHLPNKYVHQRKNDFRTITMLQKDLKIV